MTHSQRIQQLVLILISAVLFNLPASLRAAEPARPDVSQLEFFEEHIRPVLIEKCADCHSGDADAESTLAVHSRAALIKGGDYGPAILPGNAEQSLLYQSILRTHKELKMPPDADEKLKPETIANFKRWIEWGAPWPVEKSKPVTTSQKNKTQKLTTSHWCFLPRTAVSPPAVENPQWSASPIDRFVYARLQKENLKPASLAPRRTLIRRATFDLTGLSPAPQEVKAFQDDPATDEAAFAKVIDRPVSYTHLRAHET